MALIGYINWFRNYIPNLSTLIGKITEKLKKDGSNKITWTEEEENIVENINIIVQENILLTSQTSNKDLIFIAMQVIAV